MKAGYLVIAAAFAAIGLVSTSFMSNAFAHAHTTLAPDADHVNPISVVLGHSNEPTYGAKPGIHDGKHAVEVFLEDAETALPLTGASLKVDKYYFSDIQAFNKASSPNDATEVEFNVTLSPVFGDPGHYMARQVQKNGIYGYRLYGTVDYFGIAKVPIDTTVFCSMDAGTTNTSKFNSVGWGGRYGCTGNIQNTFFPENNAMVTRIDSAGNDAQIQQASSTQATAEEPISAFQIASLAGISGTAVAAFFGIRKIGRKG